MAPLHDAVLTGDASLAPSEVEIWAAEAASILQLHQGNGGNDTSVANGRAAEAVDNLLATYWP